MKTKRKISRGKKSRKQRGGIITWQSKLDKCEKRNKEYTKIIENFTNEFKEKNSKCNLSRQDGTSQENINNLKREIISKNYEIDELQKDLLKVSIDLYKIKARFFETPTADEVVSIVQKDLDDDGYETLHFGLQ